MVFTMGNIDGYWKRLFFFGVCVFCVCVCVCQTFVNIDKFGFDFRCTFVSTSCYIWLIDPNFWLIIGELWSSPPKMSEMCDMKCSVL